MMTMQTPKPENNETPCPTWRRLMIRLAMPASTGQVVATLGLVTVAGLWSAGCSVVRPGPVVKTAYYDLALAETPATTTPTVAATTATTDARRLTILDFTTVGPYNRRMAYRLANQKLDFDEYHRWADPPAMLVSDAAYRFFLQQHAFQAVTRNERMNADLVLSGEVLTLESQPGRKAVVSLHVSISNHDGQVLRSTIVNVSEPMAAATPEAFAAAASIAVNRALVEVNGFCLDTASGDK